MMRAWMPLGGAGFEQFSKLMFDSARRAAGGVSPKKDADKSK
jgi:hypothetical protein